MEGHRHRPAVRRMEPETRKAPRTYPLRQHKVRGTSTVLIGSSAPISRGAMSEVIIDCRLQMVRLRSPRVVDL